MELGSVAPVVALDDRQRGEVTAAEAALLWEAVQRVVVERPADVPLGVLVDADAHPDVADAVAASDAQLVLPLSRPGARLFELAHGDDFGAHVERYGARTVEVQLRWDPQLDPDAKKAQALALSRLAAWLHATDRSLLLDLEIPRQERAEDAEGRLDRIERTVVAIRDVGIEADVWALPGPERAEDAAAIGQVVRDAGRDAVRVLVRDEPGLDDEALRTRLRAAGAADAYGGFLLGPSLWAAPLRALRDGGSERDAVDVVADRVRDAVVTFRSEPGGSR